MRSVSPRPDPRPRDGNGPSSRRPRAAARRQSSGAVPFQFSWSLSFFPARPASQGLRSPPQRRSRATGPWAETSCRRAAAALDRLAGPGQEHLTMTADRRKARSPKQCAAWRCAATSGPAGGRGGPGVRPVPGSGGVTRGYPPNGSAVGGLSGEGPRGRSTGGEGIPLRPGDPGGRRAAPAAAWRPGKLVLSVQPLNRGVGDPPGWRPYTRSGGSAKSH